MGYQTVKVICLATLTQYNSVTDRHMPRQTDRWTDRQTERRTYILGQ